MNNLSQQLKEMPQVEMPNNVFDNIQAQVHKQSYVRKHKFISFASVAAVLLMTIMFFNLKTDNENKDYLIQELVKRTMQLEQLLVAEAPTSTIPGSKITERIVNMETWLAKLDVDIKQTKDKRKLSELMAAKLDILGDLVMLQRKINQKPDYQKVKPYII